MTEPTQAQIEDRIESAFWEFDTIRKGGSYGERDAFKIAARKLIAHIRREARNAALDKAAKVFRDCNLWDIPTGVAEEMVLALKDQP